MPEHAITKLAEQPDQSHTQASTGTRIRSHIMHRRIIRTAFTFVAASLLIPAASPLYAADDVLAVTIHYIQQESDRAPVLSSLIKHPENEGIAGAELGVSDNNTTGKFLQHTYTLEESHFESDADTIQGAREILAGGGRLAVLNVDAATLLSIADMPEAVDDLLFNARSQESNLRNANCRGNVLHTTASRAMLSDALMQFLSKRQWHNLFLIEGNRAGDEHFATALRHSARKFGLKIKHDKKWLNDVDIRRNASLEVPVFTQERKYDAIVVTDEESDFSQYLLYNTWLPRPVAGSAGLTPVVWSPVMEQWGALQLQTRFNALAERPMTDLDYSNWAAVRSIGEAITRTGNTEPATLTNYVLSDDFSLAAFKGKKMSYRPWNGQLRQPIPLVHSRAVTAMAPIDGFLHQVTELDTLGADRAESTCEEYSN